MDLAHFTKAEDAGLAAFLTSIPKTLSYGRVSSEPWNELNDFVAVLGEGLHATDVLEIGDDRRVFALDMLGTGSRLQYSTRLQEFAEALAIIADERYFTVKTEDAAATALVQQFGLIVVHRPLGERPTPNVDGFGSEVATPVASSLADDGALVWISTRGILMERVRVPQILKAAGLQLLATLDLPSGWSADTQIEGVALVFGRARSDRQLIGSMRDVGSGRVLADALLRGPTKKTPANMLWALLAKRCRLGPSSSSALSMRLCLRGVSCA